MYSGLCFQCRIFSVVIFFGYGAVLSPKFHPINLDDQREFVFCHRSNSIKKVKLFYSAPES